MKIKIKIVPLANKNAVGHWIRSIDVDEEKFKNARWDVVKALVKDAIPSDHFMVAYERELLP